VIHLIFGLPGDFIEWCATATITALHRQGFTVDRYGAGGAEDVARAAVRSKAQRVVVTASGMDDALVALAKVAAAPPVIAMAEPRQAVSAMIDAGAEPMTAFRSVMHACAGLTAVADAPGALRLSARDAAAAPEAAVAALARHACQEDAPAPEADMSAALVAALPAASRTGLAMEDGLLASAMAEALDGFADGRLAEDGALILRPRFFHAGAPPHNLLDGPVDVTGAARFVFHGGYFALPTGDWDADAVLELNESATEGRWRFEVLAIQGGGHTVAASVSGVIGAPGRHTLTASFRNQSVRTVFEWRLASERALFDGMINLRGVRMTRRAGASRSAFPAAAPRRHATQDA